MSDTDTLLSAFRGNRDAVELAFSIARIADVWDNLIDRDKPVSNDEINQAFWIALVEIPRNPFYVRHVQDLQPLIAQSIVNYQIANTLQSEVDSEALNVANVLRYSVADVIVHMAFLCGGMSWAALVGPQLRMLCQKDTLKHFMEEMEAKRAPK